MIAAGELRHVITIQERVPLKDAYGGDSYTWADFAEPRAKYLPAKGKELVSGQAVEGQITARFYIRYIGGVTSSMRIVFNGQYYDIKAALDIAGLGRELEVLATTGTSEG